MIIATIAGEKNWCKLARNLVDPLFLHGTFSSWRLCADCISLEIDFHHKVRMATSLAIEIATVPQLKREGQTLTFQIYDRMSSSNTSGESATTAPSWLSASEV